MLRSLRGLWGTAIHAKDGRIGTVRNFLFCDAKWSVRYMVVDTGTRLPGRRVLISPAAFDQIDESRKEFFVNLTREQIKQSPDIDTDRPVSRQNLAVLHMYYGWPEAVGLGPGMMPPVPPLITEEDKVEIAHLKEESDPHLRSAREVVGYHVRASDGEDGRVADFLLDDVSWELRHVVLHPQWWFPLKKVVVPVSSVDKIEWIQHTVHLGLSQEAISGSSPLAAVLNGTTGSEKAGG